MVLLNKEEPGAVLSTQNHTGGLDGSEDHADGKIFSSPGSKRCPVQTIKSYPSHLNPEVDYLFQQPEEESSRFNPQKCLVREESSGSHHAGKYAKKHVTESRVPAVFHQTLSQEENSHCFVLS